MSPISYPGGKGKIGAILLPYIPPFVEYREPFFGGGSIYFAIKQRAPSSCQFWVNDACPFVSTFWRVIRDQPAALLKRLKTDYHYLQKERHNMTDFNYTIQHHTTHKEHVKAFFHQNKKQPPKTLTEIEIAANFYWINRMSFSSVAAAGFSYTRFNRCGPQQFTKLPHVSPLLQNTRITTEDYLPLLETEGENVFLYLDPPYENNPDAQLYGRNGKLHAEFHHLRFAEALRKCKHQFILTYNDSPTIREYYKWAHIQTLNIQYDMTITSEKVDELLISNFPLRPQLQWNIHQSSLLHFVT